MRDWYERLHETTLIKDKSCDLIDWNIEYNSFSTRERLNYVILKQSSQFTNLLGTLLQSVDNEIS